MGFSIHDALYPGHGGEGSCQSGEDHGLLGEFDPYSLFD